MTYNAMLLLAVLMIASTNSVFTIFTSNKRPRLMSNEPENDLVEIISSKSYVPDGHQLPKVSVIKNEGNDATYLLSKLSDEDLIKLLNEQPAKNEYDLKDIAKIATGFNNNQERYKENRFESNLYKKFLNKLTEDKNDEIISTKPKQIPFFKLDKKEVTSDSKNEASYLALMKLNSLLKFRPQTYQDDSLDDEKKELLFNVLVNQLKALCCKKSEKKITNILKLLNDFDPIVNMKMKRPKEYIFLIINDEIKTNGSDELIVVDPETLQQNSSVLLLGPITTAMTDGQLKLIMNRITTELTKPEYLTLIQQLSDGTLSDSNLRLVKNFNRSETRRYIKPHRCNYQSKLTKVYGGPKWLICTGYINLNTPSLYD